MKFVSTIITIAIIGFIMAVIWKLIDGEHIEFLSAFVFASISLGGTWYLHTKTSEEQHKKWLLSDEKSFMVELIDAFTSSIHEDREELDKNNKLLMRLIALQPAILAHGRPNTIRAWNELREIKEKESDDGNFRKMERLFRALRKDLGHDDSKLLPGEISLILLQPDEKERIFDACKDEKYDYLIKTQNQNSKRNR